MEELVYEHGSGLVSVIMGLLFVCIAIMVIYTLAEMQVMEMQQLL